MTKLDMTSTQSAAALGIQPSRVRQLAIAGRFAGARKVGRDWLIPAKSVEAMKGRKPGRPAAK